MEAQIKEKIKKLKLELNKPEYNKINDGFIYINFYKGKQISCVYYPEQDTWYFYMDNKDVRQFNNSEMIYLLSLIDKKLIGSDGLVFIILSVGIKNHYRCPFFYNNKKLCIELLGECFNEFTDVIEKTIDIRELLNN